MAKPDRLSKVIAINIALVVVVLAVVELGLYFLVTHTTPTGVAALDKLALRIYWSQVNLIQYDPDCAQYDPELTYTLRTGGCTFANDGFSTTVEVNSAGLRDDENSLTAPEIVILGDSHAMGWGIAEADTFARIIEEETRSPVLNAGISSYGTAREILMLKRLDRSALRVLVVQYSDNDWWENRTYLENDNSLPVQPAESYARNVADNAPDLYYPGAYLRAAFGIVTAKLVPTSEDRPKAPPVVTSGMSTADLFLRLLATAEPNGSPNLVILEINTHGRGDGSFVSKAARSPELERLRAAFATVTFIDTHRFLTPEDRLFPDGHMNESGHRKVAAAVLEALAQVYATPAEQSVTQ